MGTAKGGRPEHYDEKLWRMIRGQVVSCIKSHPDYVTAHGKQKLADSIAKRVYGQVLSEEFDRLRKEVAKAAKDDEVLRRASSARDASPRASGVFSAARAGAGNSPGPPLYSERQQ